MSNHIIKAKNKLTGKIEIYSIIDIYYPYKYKNKDGDVRFTEKDFNDLFEVVEDKFKVGDRVKVNGYDGEWQISMIREDNRCTVWQIPKTGSTLIAHISLLELIPQTDTLKKEETMEDRFDKIDIKFTTDKTEDMVYLKEKLQFIFKEYKQDVKHFITQEIAKAKEEDLKKVKEYSNKEYKGDVLCGHRNACKDIIQLIQNNK